MKQLPISSSFRICAGSAISIIILCSFSVRAFSVKGKTFTSSTRSFTTMIADNRYLWAGTRDQGLWCFALAGGEPVLYTSSNSDLPDNHIKALAFDKTGALLVGTAYSSEIARFDKGIWGKKEGPGRNIYGLIVDKNGDIWVDSKNEGVSRFDGSAWIPVMNRFTGYMAGFPRSNSVWLYGRDRSIISDCNVGMLYQYVNGGLQSTVSLESLCPETGYPRFLITNEKNRWLGYTDKLIKIGSQVINQFPVNTDITNPGTRKSLTTAAINMNNVLLASVLVTDPISCEIFLSDLIFTPKGPMFDSAAFSFPDIYIISSCADYSGNFWLGASDGSIIKIDRFKKATFYAKSEKAVLPSNSVKSLVVDRKSEVWIGTENGIARFHSGDWTTYPGKGDTLPGLDVGALTLDSAGRVWAGFQQALYLSSIKSGLAYFNGRNWQSLRRDHHSIKSLKFDAFGNLWSIVHADGVYKHTNMASINTMISTKVFHTKGSSNRLTALGTMVNTIAFDKKNTPYIGTGLGVKKLVGNTWVDDSIVSHFFPANVSALSFDPFGTFWIGTSKGLIRCTKGNCMRFDTSDQVFPDPTVQCIAPYALNRALIGTKRGLVHLTEKAHTTYTNGNSPLIDNDITAIAFSGNGDAWIGTRSGGLTVLAQPTFLNPSGPSGTALRPLHRSKLFISRLSSGNRYRLVLSSPIPAEGKLKIISPGGKLIKELLPGVLGKRTTFVWDGTDMFNRIAARGIYLAVIIYHGKIFETSKLIHF